MYLHLNPTTYFFLPVLSADTVYQVSPLSSFLPGSTMCDLRQESDLETDNLEDFSLMKSRLDSFRGSDLVRHVSAERLARAGFYFIGPPDRVRCFSCQKTVENWHTGDTPVQRHKEVVIREMKRVIIWFVFVLFFKEEKLMLSLFLQVSPSCRFLSCIHHTSFNPMSTYNEEAEDMEFRLRTGQVVDESTYPMAPHMRSEEARLQTFSFWPSTAPMEPRDLAQAGLYYLGESDRVQCFCCGGMLGGWDAGDTAWGEHNKHFPYCFFILGHDVGNIPFEGVREEEEQGSSRQHATATRVSMGSFEERLGSFAGVQHPIDQDKLARAGFYSSGRALIPEQNGHFLEMKETLSNILKL